MTSYILTSFVLLIRVGCNEKDQWCPVFGGGERLHLLFVGGHLRQARMLRVSPEASTDCCWLPQATNDMIILQTLHWRMQLSIEVNPNRPLGQRARLREPIAQDQPKILSKNEPIPPSALVKPNANDAQVLMWRPKYGQPLVVIPPKHR
uniref:Uncharacterized protein n=1 Tax=Colobus angolensis palliatus TaxID=336983 RepID=A0A2K5HYE0_COLAP